MSDNILNAQTRTTSGKGGARQLRAKGLIPGVYYGRHEDNIHFCVGEVELGRLLRHRHTILSLKIDNTESRDCIIRSIQRDPVDSKFIHIDLLAIHSGEKITVTVPVHLHGVPLGVKEGGGVLEHGLNELTIECLPGNIPEFIDIDVTNLALGHSIHIKDVSLENVRILDDEHAIVAHVAAPKLERAAADETVAAEGVEQVETED